MAANTYWTDARLSAQRPAARTLTIPHPATPAFDDVVPRARRRFTVPSWVVFCMIMLATFAVCATVTMRTHAGMLSAEVEFRQMSAEVGTLSEGNVGLQREVEQLRRQDPHRIEAAARERLNMVRPNEVVVPLD